MAQASGRDWLLCQVTTNPYADSRAIELDGDSLDTGILLHTSYARPAQLFTAHQDLLGREVATLKAETFNRLLDSTIELLNGSRR